MACDVANSITDVWFRLGFLSYAEMSAGALWLTPTELYQFGDDAGKRLSCRAAAFVLASINIAVTAGDPSYALDASHVFTLMAWFVATGTPLQILRLSTVGQLFALDANWGATTGPPTRASLDAGSVGTVTLYPNPTANGTLYQIWQQFPSIASGSSVVAVSPVLQDYFSYALLTGALGKESDFAKPEVAAHCQERMKLYEAVAAHLWGRGQ